MAVFGSPDPRSGTERLVVLAETRETEAARRDALRAEVNALAIDLIGTPVDEVVLESPGTILKTSSGKIRRAANRDLYERGLTGRRRLGMWWSVAEMALSGVTPGMRRLRRSGAS
ncbi:MAG: acyl-phosphate glycerol 3-phosphate acyltransferase, partial [Syntrophaceae bacterium]